MGAGCLPSCSHSFPQAGPEECKMQKLLDKGRGHLRITVTVKTGLAWRKLLYCLLEVEYDSEKQAKAVPTTSWQSSLFSSQVQLHSFIPNSCIYPSSAGQLLTELVQNSFFHIFSAPLRVPCRVQSFKTCSSVDPCL